MKAQFILRRKLTTNSETLKTQRLIRHAIREALLSNENSSTKGSSRVRTMEKLEKSNSW